MLKCKYWKECKGYSACNKFCITGGGEYCGLWKHWKSDEHINKMAWIIVLILAGLMAWTLLEIQIWKLWIG